MKTILTVLFAVFTLQVSSSVVVFVVTKTTDPNPLIYKFNYDDSQCDTVMKGTLQWAIRKANLTYVDTIIIEFNIPGYGVYEILLNYELPMIITESRQLIIDGTSQSGYIYGTPLIKINGQDKIGTCFQSYKSKITIKGFAITDFLYHGIVVNTPFGTSEVKENNISNIDNGENTTAAIAIRMIMSGTANQVNIQGNNIGTESTNTNIEDYGMFIESSYNCLIGGTGQNQSNTITNCGRRGIYIASSNSIQISANRIYNNPVAIYLSYGSNNNKAAPVISSFNGTTVTGTSEPYDIIEIYAGNNSQNAEVYIGTCITDANGDWSLNVSSIYKMYFLATATDNMNNTSIFTNKLSFTYEGEYQIWLGGNDPYPFNDYFYWVRDLLKPESAYGVTKEIMYKIENVSFPFVPDNLFDAIGNINPTCYSDINNRILLVPSDNLYGNVIHTLHDMSIENKGLGWGSLIIDKGNVIPIGINSLVNYMGRPTSLITSQYSFEYPTYQGRDFYPHSVLKYTLYYYYNGLLIDSLVFINDLTRDNMKSYPFCDQNGSCGTAQYDLVVRPSINATPSSKYNDTYNSLGTVNYFPIPLPLIMDFSDQNYINIYPDPNGTLDESFMDVLAPETYYYYTHPTPFSLIQSQVMNDDGSHNAGEDHSGNPLLTGIEHFYNIDKNINLRNINPNEKIIYNPSVCDITASHLVFPSGYTFKTLHAPGEYILKDDVLENYPHVLYDESEWKDMPVSTNSQPAHYIIKSGAKLTIEPCVTIMDAIFTVELGGILEYDETQTYGNFQIDPLSAGTYNPIISDFSNCDCDCKDFRKYNENNIDIAGNVTWDQAYIESSFEVPTGGVLGIAGKVTIPAGVTLTIKNIQIQFSNIGEIIVEPGARLIVDGSVLKSACNKLWVGINVKGNSNLPQLLTCQGFVSLKNSSEIRDASYAINIKSGGIVSTIGTTFKNNKIGIYFHPYQLQSNNISSITNNTFITETQRAYNSLLAHVYLNGVRGVNLKGNDFINTQGSTVITSTGISPLYANARGYGIYSKNSSFKVLPLCSSPMQYGVSCPESYTKESNFSGLYYGIKANAINSSMPVTIQQSRCDGNFRGVLLENFQYPNVLDNKFFGTYSGLGINPELLYPPTNNNSVYGLYLNGCSNYRVEENEFTNGDAGIFVYNSGASANRIYKNIYTDVNKTGNASALNALGSNSDWDGNSLSGYIGLQFECNEFNTSMYNMTVLGSSTISKTQGSINLTTGNTMDHFYCSSITESDFYIGPSSPITNYMYYYELGSSLQSLSCYSLSIYPDDITFHNSCPSLLTTPVHPIPILKSNLYNSQIIITEKEDELKSLIDGGDTEGLLNLVENIKPNNFNSTCNALLNIAPYASDTVLVRFMDANINGHADKKRDVLLANSPLPEKAKARLNDYWMPPPMKQSVLNAQQGINAIEQKEIEISALQTERQNLLNIFIASALYNDSIPGYIDTVIDFLMTETDYRSKYYLIPLLIEKGNFSEADNQLTSLSAVASDLPQSAALQLNNYIDLMEIVVYYFENNKDSTIIINNLNFILNLAETDNVNNIGAQILLEHYKNDLYDYPEKIEFPGSSDLKTMKVDIPETQNQHSETEDIINIYPNPAENIVNVEYKLTNDCNNGVVEIYDLPGRLIISEPFKKQTDNITLDISNIPNGVYFIVFKANGIKKQIKQINIIH